MIEAVEDESRDVGVKIGVHGLNIDTDAPVQGEFGDTVNWKYIFRFVIL